MIRHIKCHTYSQLYIPFTIYVAKFNGIYQDVSIYILKKYAFSIHIKIYYNRPSYLIQSDLFDK